MKILGLDLGTNSIGWALVEQSPDQRLGKILGLGSRIIPMSQDVLNDFGKGNSISQTAERTKYRSSRRLKERTLLRRERLHRILNVLGFLPEHYALQIDFDKRLGKFINDSEPKIAYQQVWNEVKGKNDYDFIFKKSFEEMLDDFRKHRPEVLMNEKGESKLIPYDWTIYYLRKKALTERIEKEELSWILLNFNQKRGYYQARGEDDEAATRTAQTRIYFDTQVITDVVDTGLVYGGLKIIQITLANGDQGKYFSKELPDWIGQEKNIIVTVDLDKEGNDKHEEDGTLKRKFSIPTEEDWDKKWKLLKIKTEKEINDSKKTVGTYIYDTLLQNTRQKIKGKLVRTIERKFYKEELKQILQKQKECHPELQNDDFYNDSIRELYRNNEAHQMLLASKDFVHLFLNDIIFYQRPLRSQKSSIGNCALEYKKYKNENGEGQSQYLKAIPKSNPYFQEFRLWQWIYNLSIYKRDDDTNVTADFLDQIEDFENLFIFLNNRRDIEQKPLVKFLLGQKGVKGRELNVESEKYRWNYVEDKKYPCNETRAAITNGLGKVPNIKEDFFTRDIEQKLWHIIYSVTDKVDYEKALKSFADKYALDVFCFVESFKKLPPFKSEYGSYSEKAIKKLLPLMRLGKFWGWEAIDEHTRARIEKIITGEYDESIKKKVREKALHMTQKNHFQGLQLWLAQYIVYGRHSESATVNKWNSTTELEQYLRDFKQHALRNPIVQQVITETLRLVKDIWVGYGKGEKDFFNEIHIELGREMKNTADERERITNQVTENENTNLRIKALLAELKNDSNVENVRQFSPMQQEILKIYEEGVLNSVVKVDDEILKISKTAQPTSAQLKRYKLWLEQKYKSPYTGEIIPLNKLFTTDYEIEHIIPESRYFDDSLSNKVICESAVNKLKDNQLGREFITNHHGEKVQIGNKCVEIFEIAAYEDFVKQHYLKNRSKRNKLLLDEIPDKMIERQMNDTRYISKFISSILSNIVRLETNDDGVNSKNLIPGNGKITARLKQDWGLNDVWNDLMLPRFERLNKLTNSASFTVWSNNFQKFLPTVPLELSKNFSKKRIDHRHHAMDALVIACATRDHINLLNNVHAKSGERFNLNRKLRKFEKVAYNHMKTGQRIEREIPKGFYKPWENFTVDARNALDSVVISFKQNLRVINKATNHYEKWTDENQKKKKTLQQQKGTNWAIRKSMHEDTFSGKVNLSWVKPKKGEIITATRKPLDSSFTIEKIKKITDTGIQKILKKYLAHKNNNSELAFAPEGIEELNTNIRTFNDGKFHQPITKVRIYEKGSGRFPLGQNGNKSKKYVQGSPNLFFAVYQSEDGKRSFDTVRFNEVIEHQKWRSTLSKEEQSRVPLIPIKIDKGEFLFSLSPNDLVYVPSEEELNNNSPIDFRNLSREQRERLYNVNDFSTTCYFSPNRLAKAITAKEVDMNYDTQKNKITGSFDTKTASIEGRQIKDICIKLLVDRIGNIIPYRKHPYLV